MKSVSFYQRGELLACKDKRIFLKYHYFTFLFFDIFFVNNLIFII